MWLFYPTFHGPDIHLHLTLGHVSWAFYKVLARLDVVLAALCISCCWSRRPLETWSISHLCLSLNSKNGLSPFALGWAFTSSPPYNYFRPQNYVRALPCVVLSRESHCFNNKWAFPQLHQQADLLHRRLRHMMTPHVSSIYLFDRVHWSWSLVS